MLNRFTAILIVFVMMCFITANTANSGWFAKYRKQFSECSSKQIQHIEDIQYADKNMRCKLDIYKTNTSAKEKPIILFVHGGGWKRGDKSESVKKGKYFAENGYIFISINYPLFPYAGYKAQAESVARAVAWTYKHAEGYNGSRKDIILMGHSSGGHLVALIATDDSYLKSVNLGLKNIRETILIDAAGLDILRIKRSHPRAFSIIYNPVFGNDPKILKRASPIAHIRDDKYIPPFLIFHSTFNRKISQPSKDFFNRAHKKNTRTRIYGIRANHFKINNRIGDKEDKITQIIIDHLQR